MTVQFRITRILSTLLIAGLCSAPLLRAQQTNPATPQQAPETSQQPQQPATTQPAQAIPPATTDQAQPANDAPAPAPAQNTQPIAPANQNQPQHRIAGNQREPVASAAAPVTTYPDASGHSRSNHRRTPRRHKHHRSGSAKAQATNRTCGRRDGRKCSNLGRCCGQTRRCCYCSRQAAPDTLTAAQDWRSCCRWRGVGHNLCAEPQHLVNASGRGRCRSYGKIVCNGKSSNCTTDMDGPNPMTHSASYFQHPLAHLFLWRGWFG